VGLGVIFSSMKMKVLKRSFTFFVIGSSFLILTYFISTIDPQINLGDIAEAELRFAYYFGIIGAFSLILSLLRQITDILNVKEMNQL